ncbi:hypothetical protein DMB37_14055 [Nocardia sp. CS682]|nr:hypothetical protein DMB37_14055 [Nocardia sp. CS682]
MRASLTTTTDSEPRTANLDMLHRGSPARYIGSIRALDPTTGVNTVLQTDDVVAGQVLDGVLDRPCPAFADGPPHQ